MIIIATYPHALNPPNEPAFKPALGTLSVNGLTDALLYSNPNYLNSAVNGTAAANPFRLDRSEAATNDQDHDYLAEQQAFHAGLMDSFPQVHRHPGPPSGWADHGWPGRWPLRRQIR